MRVLSMALLLFGVCTGTLAQTTINPTADAYVHGGAKAAKNFGTATLLKAQTNAKAAKNFDSYLKFDLSTVSPLSAATLRLYARLSHTGSLPVSIYAVSNTAWSETAITWNNKPARGAALASVTVANKTFAWYEFNVTAYVQSERAAGRTVLALGLHAASASALTLRANSRQATANQPQLVFTSNAAPTVSLTAPAAGSVFAAPATITLSATAADADGTISKVEFFQGTTLLNATTVSPYSFDWTNVAAGSYSLTAKATDNLGAATTSSPVNITVTGQAALYFIHPDQLNTPRVITNEAQQVVWRWDNDDAFGGNMANENPSGLGRFTFNLRFPGQYFDKETNLHYNYYRDYSPDIGRYIESDPIGLGGGLNTYSYVGSNPLSKIDPPGLFLVFLFNSEDIEKYLGPILITVPKKVPGMFACNAKCPTIPTGAVCPTPDCQPVEGYGVGSSLSEAKRNAKSDANSKIPAGCQGKHCTYKCISPQGDPIFPSKD